MRGRTRGSALRPVAATCLVLAGLLAIPASSTAKTVVATSSGVGNAAFVTAVANCPKGQRAAGGGFATSPPADLAFIQVYESRKIGQSSWQVTGQITDRRKTFASRSLDAYAYCTGNSDRAPHTQQVSKTATTLDSGGNLQFGSSTASCPKEKTARAGGFMGEPPFTGSNGAPRSTLGKSLLVNKDGDPALKPKVGHKFSVLSAIPGITFTSFVYCAHKKSLISKGGVLDAVGQGTLTTAFSGECTKESRRPNAGGFDQPNASLSPKGYYDPIIGSLKVGEQWWVTAVHNGPAVTQLQSIGYCS
jgi:hypothetical protein